MGTKDHYVSQFHLRQFVDPSAAGERNPWLWEGRIDNLSVRRKSPKNLGFATSLYQGPGGFSDKSKTIEKYLAEKIEAPAASALKEVCSRPHGSGGELPPILMTYVAWAAARSLPMKKLFNDWSTLVGSSSSLTHDSGQEVNADHRRAISMVHSDFGKTTVPEDRDIKELLAQGWMYDFDDPENFLELVHLQAYEFETRWLPQFRWYTLHAPKGSFFIIADRAVAWAADGYIDAPPNCLSHPSAYMVAPLSRDLVLIGRHGIDAWQVSPGLINTIIACWAHEWIAGPTEQTVVNALSARRFSLK